MEEAGSFVLSSFGLHKRSHVVHVSPASRLSIPVASHAKVWTNQLTYSFVYCSYLFNNHQNDYMHQECSVAIVDHSRCHRSSLGGFSTFCVPAHGRLGGFSTTIPTALCSSALPFLLIKPRLRTLHIACTNLFCNLYYSLLIRAQEHHPSLMLIIH